MATMTKRDPGLTPEAETLDTLMRAIAAKRATLGRLTTERDAEERLAVGATDPATQRRHGRRVNVLQEHIDDASAALQVDEARYRDARTAAIAREMATARPEIAREVGTIRELLIDAQVKTAALHGRIERLAETTASEAPRAWAVLAFPPLMNGADSMLATWLRALEREGW